MSKASDNKFPKVIITEGSAPSNADSGDQKLFIDSADHHVKRKNSSGTVVDIEAVSSEVDNTAYDATSWDGDTTHAPSKNAVRDKIESLGGGGTPHVIIGAFSQAAASGTWAGLDASIFSRIYNSSGGNGDYADYICYLTAGTYAFQLLYSKGSNGGKVDILVDGATVVSGIDMYGTGLPFFALTTGIVIATSGFKTIRIKLNGKNAGSSGYYAFFAWLELWRTS